MDIKGKLKLPSIKRIKIPKSKKGKAAAIIVLAVIVGVTYVLTSMIFAKEVSAEYTEYTVEKGNIETTVSGSGTVEPANMYEVIALVQGDVLQADFEEGDEVEEGQMLYVIDASDVENTIDRSELSLEKAASSYKKSAAAVEDLNVKAPMSGKIGEISVSVGDIVKEDDVLATVYDNNTLVMKVPFSINDAVGIYTGQSATVTLENTFETLTGTVTKVYGSERVVDGYVTVTDIEISVNNPGSLQSGTYATASVNAAVSYSSGTLAYEDEETIKASAAGTVEKIYCTEGELVNSKTLLMKISSDAAADSLESNYLSYRDAQLSYENTQQQMDNYNITAPIKGTIIEKTVKAGDTIDSSTSTTIMTTIADMSTMTFELSVDELDVAKMEEGQKVNIIADALENQTFTGTVNNISLKGTSTDGVTSYPVTIVIDEAEGLWPGMNVTAEIVVESAEDVLKIPVTAVSRGNKVLVRSTGETAQDGYEYVQVTLGINDDDYIQVVDGLSEGDIIQVPVVVKTTSSTTDAATMGGGMAGGGGGMPSGGGAPPM